MRPEFPYRGIRARSLALLRSEFTPHNILNAYLDYSFPRDQIKSLMIDYLNFEESDYVPFFKKKLICVVLLRYYL